jgi:hypothetical protein
LIQKRNSIQSFFSNFANKNTNNQHKKNEYYEKHFRAVGLGAGRNATCSDAACDDAHDHDGVGTDNINYQRWRHGLHAIHGFHRYGRKRQQLG